MIAFINEHRDTYGVEPICKVLPIAPSTYRLHAARQRDPSLLPDRARRDLVLMEEIERVFETNYSVYGARKVWRQLRREGRDVARCTVERLMRDLGLAGAIRGKPVKTTVSDKGAACPLDKVNRQFQAPEPNRLWVADFTYVATWAGFVYVAFVIDAFARRIVGWRVSRTAHASFVLDALEQAIHARKPAKGSGLVHHSDRGVQYLSIKYSGRLAEAGIDPSVGSVGDSYDNALAETIIQDRGARLADLAVDIWRRPVLTDRVLASYETPRAGAGGYMIEHHPHLRPGAPMHDLFEAVRQAILALGPQVREEFLRHYVAYKTQTNFVDVVPQKRRLRLTLNMRFDGLSDPRGLAADITNLGRWGNGDVQVELDNERQNPYAMDLVRQAFAEKQPGGDTPVS